MYKLVSVAEMQLIEREANDRGLSYAAMMENAGTSVAKYIDQAFGKCDPRGVIALVGSGNNGGDALVALGKLREAGWRTFAYLVKSRHKDDIQLQRYAQMGGEIIFAENDVDRQCLYAQLTQSSVIIDGILGTGARLPIPTEISKVTAHIKGIVREKHGVIHVVAVDCPSGVDCDTGAVSQDVIPADVTITMAAVKRGMITFPAANFGGDIRVGEIGDINGLDAYKAIKRSVLTDLDIKQSLPIRPRDAHKGTFGTVLMVLGSGNYPGAVLLAGMGAYRIGAGLVRIAVPQLIYPALIGQLIEATWVRIPHANGWISEDAIQNIKNALIGVSALLVGPGFGLEKTTREFIRQCIALELPKTVIDADGLKLLSEIPDWHSILHREVVLTPHPGEMAALTGLSIEEIQQHRLEVAESYARLWEKVIVLKGAYTVISNPDGNSVVVPVATPALARAGTGDVLAGIIVGLLAQGMGTFQAAYTGAYLHAMAGLEAERDYGNSASVLAGDVLNMIPKILVRYK